MRGTRLRTDQLERTRAWRNGEPYWFIIASEETALEHREIDNVADKMSSKRDWWEAAPVVRDSPSLHGGSKRPASWWYGGGFDWRRVAMIGGYEGPRGRVAMNGGYEW